MNKSTNWKGILLCYLQSRKLFVLAIILSAMITFLTFKLYDIWLEVYFALMGILTIVFVMLVAIDFYSFNKLYRVVRRVASGASVKDIRRVSGDNLSCQMLKIIANEQLKQSDMIAHHQGQYRNLQDDYTQWVHQIKTPVSALRLMIERQTGADRQALKSELFKVERYIDMALEIVRLQSKTNDLHFEAVSINCIMTKLAKKYKSIFIEKKIKLIFSGEDLTVISDQKWLIVAVEQILSNALKYTNQGEISIEYHNQSLVIKDSGIGIMAEDIPRIFERGYTGYNARVLEKSTGIGLNICKRTLDMLGHNIKIQSEVGKGTVAIISF